MDGGVTGLHDIAEGGLGLAVGEMAVSSGVGFQIAGPDSVGLFSEAPSRVVVCYRPPPRPAWWSGPGGPACPSPT